MNKNDYWWTKFDTFVEKLCICFISKVDWAAGQLIHLSLFSPPMESHSHHYKSVNHNRFLNIPVVLWIKTRWIAYVCYNLASEQEFIY